MTTQALAISFLCLSATAAPVTNIEDDYLTPNYNSLGDTGSSRNGGSYDLVSEWDRTTPGDKIRSITMYSRSSAPET